MHAVVETEVQVTVGVEGSGSYGAGLARWLRGRGVQVIEVERPKRQHRRRHGKSIELFEFGRNLVQLACENMYAPYRVGDEIRPRVISLLQPSTSTAPPSLSVQRELLW